MNEKILVVDDEPGMLALLEVILRRKGFMVLSDGGDDARHHRPRTVPTSAVSRRHGPDACDHALCPS
jgi:DNA-binding response OmpR family regulator